MIPNIFVMSWLLFCCYDAEGGKGGDVEATCDGHPVQESLSYIYPLGLFMLLKAELISAGVKRHP